MSTFKNRVLDDIVIPVMGATGAGKSSFINYLLDKNFDGNIGTVRVGHSLTSCTADIQAVELENLSSSWLLRGRKVVILDTPGFDDTYTSDVEILRRIAEWLKTSYKKKMILAGVLYLHDLSQDRFTGTAKRNLEMFRQLCGDQALRKTVLVTTKWSKQDRFEERGREERKEKELRSKHWNELLEKGCEMQRFERTQESAINILEVFLNEASVKRRKEIAGVALQIQDELVNRRKYLPQTKAGKKLRYTLEEVLALQKQMLELEAKGLDENGRKQLREMEGQMGQLVLQLSTLKTSFAARFKQYVQGKLSGGQRQGEDTRAALDPLNLY